MPSGSEDFSKQRGKYREQISKFESIPSSSFFDTHRNTVLTLLTEEINSSEISIEAKAALNHIIESKKILQRVSTKAHFPQASSDSDGDISS